MHPRRQRLAQWIATQAAASAPRGEHDIAELRAFALREPVSGRTYTVIRLRSRDGISGYGECGRVSTANVEAARRAVVGQPATRYSVTSTGTPLDGAIATAMLDITARIARTPVFRLLGGPTRAKVRALAQLHGGTDEAVSQSLRMAVHAGFRAVQVPLPTPSAHNQGQAFQDAVRARLGALLKEAGPDIDFVLDGAGGLTPGDAASVASAVERFHVLWFDEPCRIMNTSTLHKLSDESVTPLGFGRGLHEPSVFQDLLREGAVDVVRPELHHYGIPRVRQIAALAETWYTAVAPHHEGGPVGTAAALHLAASLPNFFIQHVPLSPAEEDRRMRAELAGETLEAPREGFLALPAGNGLGIDVKEAALEKYQEVQV